MTETSPTRRTSARPTRTDVDTALPAAPLMPKPNSSAASGSALDESPDAMIERLKREIEERNAQLEAANAERNEAEKRARVAEAQATEAKIRIEEMNSTSVPVFTPSVSAPSSILSSSSFAPMNPDSLILVPVAASAPPRPSPPRKVISAEEYGDCDTLVIDAKNLGSPPFAVEWATPPDKHPRATAVTLRFVGGKARIPREIAVALAEQSRYLIQN